LRVEPERQTKACARRYKIFWRQRDVSGIRSGGEVMNGHFPARPRPASPSFAIRQAGGDRKNVVLPSAATAMTKRTIFCRPLF